MDYLRPSIRMFLVLHQQIRILQKHIISRMLRTSSDCVEELMSRENRGNIISESVKGHCNKIKNNFINSSRRVKVLMERQIPFSE